MEVRKCPVCSKEFTVDPTKHDDATKRYCTKRHKERAKRLRRGIAVERRGPRLSLSTQMYTADAYKHFCPTCAELGIEE